jgi:hypothetical protein
LARRTGGRIDLEVVRNLVNGLEPGHVQVKVMDAVGSCSLSFLRDLQGALHTDKKNRDVLEAVDVESESFGNDDGSATMSFPTDASCASERM